MMTIRKMSLTLVVHNLLKHKDLRMIKNDPHLKKQITQITQELPAQYPVISKHGLDVMTCSPKTGEYMRYPVEVFFCPAYHANTFVVKLHNDPRTGVGRTTRVYFTYDNGVLSMRNIGHYDAKTDSFTYKNHE